jgi:osmotically-inducible protein OsmY
MHRAAEKPVAAAVFSHPVRRHGRVPRAERSLAGLVATLAFATDCQTERLAGALLEDREGARTGKRKGDVMSTTVTRTEQHLRDSVLSQLAWDPEVDATMIGVAVKDGIVTLSGYVPHYAARLAAERAARKLFGVRAVVNELQVKLAHERVDPDLASDALRALASYITVPKDLEVTVRNGYITLAGTVEWMYQKAAAERAVRYLKGVRGVFNHITVTPTVSPEDVQHRITEALHRHADIDARRISVEAIGGHVVLTGNVQSWIERREAERAAWTVPGVTFVDDRLTIVP